MFWRVIPLLSLILAGNALCVPMAANASHEFVQTEPHPAGLVLGITSLPQFNRTLELGTIGADVTALQQLLKDTGFYGVALTDTFDVRTQTALKLFQRANALGVTGILDDKTRNFLNGTPDTITQEPFVHIPTLRSTATSTQPVPTVPTIPTTPNSTVRALDLGATGPDVTALQEVLRDTGYFKHDPTGYFGALTKAAVILLQQTHNLDPVGIVGPKTRALISSQAIKAPPSNPTPAVAQQPATASQTPGLFSRTISIGATGADVTALQILLKEKGYLSAEATGYFGPLTYAAVKLLQEANGFESVGLVGPKTRALLNSFSIVKAQSPTTPAVIPQPPILPVSPTVPTPNPITPPSSLSDVTRPSTPTNLAASASVASQVNLVWTAATDNVGVTSYRVYRNGIQIGTTALTSYTDAGRSPNTQYTYTVAALDTARNISLQSSI
ncbi:MAG: peptidoglycan-binding protein, partial [Patescibacteria group bacterium]